MVIECVDNSNGSIVLVNIANVTTMVQLDGITRICFVNATYITVFNNLAEIGAKIKAGGM